jgi:uncharacterized protein
MSMQMSDEIVLTAQRSAVWAMLNDPAILRQCIPGCESLERTAANEMQAVAKIKIGPVSARFKGKVAFEDVQPLSSYRIVGSGEGGIAGFAKGSAQITLSDHGDGTLMRYNVDAEIGGKLAQLGSRLINSVAKKLADEFFRTFASVMSSEPETTTT